MRWQVLRYFAKMINWPQMLKNQCSVTKSKNGLVQSPCEVLGLFSNVVIIVTNKWIALHSVNSASDIDYSRVTTLWWAKCQRSLEKLFVLTSVLDIAHCLLYHHCKGSIKPRAVTSLEWCWKGPGNRKGLWKMPCLSNFLARSEKCWLWGPWAVGQPQECRTEGQ